MRDIYGIRDFLFNVWLLIKEIINLIFCIFFTFATFFVVYLIQFACLTHILETGDIVLTSDELDMKTDEELKRVCD